MIARIAKAGYFAGDPVKIANAPAKVVIDMLNYEIFTSAYEAEYLELNKPEGS